jgi:hypothetical protein
VGGFGNSVCQIGKPHPRGVTPRRGGSPPCEGVAEEPHHVGDRPASGGWCSAGRRRPATRAHFPGMHADFLFFVVSIVSGVVRAQSGKSAGRIFYVHGRPPSPGACPAGRRSCTSPAGRRAAAVLVLCDVMACAAVHEPVGARATRRGLVLCGVVRPCTPGRLQAPVPRRHVRPLSFCKSMGMPAPARGRQRPRASPRDHVHERRPARLADVATRARARLPLEVCQIL